ncbi:MAG TPA: hypothetical protein VNF49_13570 [Candidatus Binataceae bacterium]|nr:hypothetical protein [Candidatus Binataceae bacterium]
MLVANGARTVVLEPSMIDKTSEKKRVDFLVERDGLDSATAWVARTLDIYRRALTDHASYARLPQYRPQFEVSIRTFESWILSQEQRKGAASP